MNCCSENITAFKIIVFQRFNHSTIQTFNHSTIQNRCLIERYLSPLDRFTGPVEHGGRRPSAARQWRANITYSARSANTVSAVRWSGLNSGGECGRRSFDGGLEIRGDDGGGVTRRLGLGSETMFSSSIRRRRHIPMHQYGSRGTQRDETISIIEFSRKNVYLMRSNEAEDVFLRLS